MTIDTDMMLWGFALGLFLGTSSCLIGLFIKSVFRWMGF